MYQTNILRLPLILLILTFIDLTSLGQQQFGIKVSGGLSRITNSLDLSNANRTIPFVPSGQCGLYYNLQFCKKSSLGAELLFSQIKGKEKTEMDLTGWDESESGHFTSIYNRHISYLSLPVYYGFQIGKLSINAGFQVSCALLCSGREKTNIVINGTSETADNKYDDISIRKFDFGTKTGITYKLTDKLAFEGTYYYGLNSIQKGDPIFWKLKVQQATIGIRYSLWYKGAKDGNKIGAD